MAILRHSRPLIALIACLPLTSASARTPLAQSPNAPGVTSASAAPLTPAVPRIGMNLDGTGLSYYGTQYPFIDRVLTLAATTWSVTGTDWKDLPAGSIRINPQTGLPAEQAKNVQFVNTLFNIEPASLPTPHRYIITWKGSAQVEIGFNAAANVKRTKQSYAFDFTANQNQAQIIIRGLTDADPLRDLHIVRIDQLPAFESGEVFNPEFIAKVSQWSVIRFMDWSAVNASQLTSYDELPKPDRISYGDGRGVPIKIMVDLCNRAKTDMWYNIPAHANDDFVRSALTYIRDHLAPDRKLHLEYSNEVWNGGFEQAKYAQDQGRALGQRLNLDHPIGTMEWYGYRSAQIAALTDQVFGAESRRRVANVVGTQTYYEGLEKYMWDGVALAKLGTPAKLFEEYAITTYFGHSLGGGSDADKATALGWARSGAAGVDSGLHELEVGGALSDNSSIVTLRKLLAYHGNVARTYGLKLVAYEGGAHLTANGYQGEDQQVFAAYIKKLVDDPRMSSLYAKMIDGFGAAGGRTLVAFTDVGQATGYGAWGVLDNIYQQHSPRYDALVAASKRAARQP